MFSFHFYVLHAPRLDFLSSALLVLLPLSVSSFVSFLLFYFLILLPFLHVVTTCSYYFESSSWATLWCQLAGGATNGWAIRLHVSTKKIYMYM